MQFFVWFTIVIVVLGLAAATEQSWRDSDLPVWRKLIWLVAIYAFLASMGLWCYACVE